MNKAVFDQHVPAHVAYVKDLIDQGYAAKSGYWAEYGGGMLLFRANSIDEARAIVAADPLIQHHCVEYELHEWRVVVE